MKNNNSLLVLSKPVEEMTTIEKISLVVALITYIVGAFVITYKWIQLWLGAVMTLEDFLNKKDKEDEDNDE